MFTVVQTFINFIDIKEWIILCRNSITIYRKRRVALSKLIVLTLRSRTVWTTRSYWGNDTSAISAASEGQCNETSSCCQHTIHRHALPTATVAFTAATTGSVLIATSPDRVQSMFFSLFWVLTYVYCLDLCTCVFHIFWSFCFLSKPSVSGQSITRASCNTGRMKRTNPLVRNASCVFVVAADICCILIKMFADLFAIYWLVF